MATCSNVMVPAEDKNEEDQKARQYSSFKEEVESLISTLPTKRLPPYDICEYQGYWIDKPFLTGILISRKYFKAQPSNVFLASQPKCGTTWLKALLFSIINRSRFEFATHPLLSSNPHDLVDYLELYAYFNPSNPNPNDPLLATHMPYSLLPDSIKSCSPGCPIIYIARDPKDAFVSGWLFASKLSAEAVANSSTSLEEQLHLFCKGIWPFGPCWDHILEYWKSSQEYPNKVMFITYEHMKTETYTTVKAMAEFIGRPFSPDEEKDGVIQKVIDLCSFDNLKQLDINQKEAPFKPNVPRIGFKNYAFFRQGKVGGYTSLLTEEMIRRIDEITESKFKGSGLVFN